MPESAQIPIIRNKQSWIKKKKHKFPRVQGSWVYKNRKKREKKAAQHMKHSCTLLVSPKTHKTEALSVKQKKCKNCFRGVLEA